MKPPADTEQTMPSTAFNKLIALRDNIMRVGASAMMYLDDYGAAGTIRDIRSMRDRLAVIERLSMTDFIALTRDEVIQIGFYQSEQHPGLFQLPMWMWWIVPYAGNFESTFDNNLVRYNFSAGKPLGCDNRGGFMGLGVRFHPDGTMNLGA